MFSLLNQLISSHLNILVEKVASKYLLSILVVDNVGTHEEKTKSGLSCELQILIVEECIVVVKEKELYRNTLLNKNNILMR